MTKEFTSQPTCGCDATSLDLASLLSPGLEPETSAGFAVGYYPLRHPRSGSLKVIPFSKIYTLKIISQITYLPT